MTKILLDTNAYTHFIAGSDAVLEVLAEAEIVYMSIFVLGELYAGFRGGRKEADNKKILNGFLSKPTVKILNATVETARVFGRVKEGLKSSGNPIPTNDVWIAAHTLETGSTLITFDRHFQKIAGLMLWDGIEA